MDPLFPDEPDRKKTQPFLLHKQEGKRVEPTSPAVELIRYKLDALYAQEPSARQELAEVKHAPTPRSKHQQFMYDLSTSGKSLAEIQTAWHSYYASLPDEGKHEVWQEFYAANADRTGAQFPPIGQAVLPQQPATHVVYAPPERTLIGLRPRTTLLQKTARVKTVARTKERNLGRIKQRILHRVRTSNSARLKAKQHLQSLLFGLGLGTLVLLVFLFSFFNEVVIAPFIRPGQAGATPIILNTDAIAPSSTPELIIPKINAQLPVIYDNKSISEADIQRALEDGVIHYPTTAVPGQRGNAAYFGHSSNNIFNKGKYKFAFVLLRELEPGDLFYLTYEGKVYTYKVFQKRVVEPEDTWVLGPVADKPATATLITCDPPGTSLHRLVVWGEQITPDPGGNATAPAATTPVEPEQLPSEGPTLLGRFWRWVTPW